MSQIQDDGSEWNRAQGRKQGKWTSGPWIAEPLPAPSGYAIRRLIGRMPSVILATIDYDHPRDIAKANADLITAAPDLAAAAVKLEEAEAFNANCLECEQQIAPELCGRCFPLFDDARVMRRLALAKARGETP